MMDLKKKPLKDDEKKTGVFDPKDHYTFNKDKKYHWCPHHIMWCVHTDVGCDKGKGKDVKHKSVKKKRGHDRKDGDKELSILVE